MDAATIISIGLGIPVTAVAVLTLINYLKKKKSPEVSDETDPLGQNSDSAANNRGTRAANSEPVHSNCLVIGDMRFDYLKLIGSWEKGSDEYRYGDVVTRIVETDRFQAPEDLRRFVREYKDEKYNQKVERNQRNERVRLENYKIEIQTGFPRNGLDLVFSRITYSDYLLTGHLLDEQIPGEERKFRDKYFNGQQGYTIKDNPLSNICGVGVFVVTSDNKVLVVKRSGNVTVSPCLYSYSASGTMHWNDHKVNPFDEIIRECREEIGYKISSEELTLFALGLDVKGAYFQFSFVARTAENSERLLANARGAHDYAAEIDTMLALDFDYKKIIDHINDNNWDACSAAALITLCAKQYGQMKLENYTNPNRLYDNFRRIMIDEWGRRAERDGRYAVMSYRYPPLEIDDLSEGYKNKIMDFIGNAIRDKDVLEVGCGIGIVTRELEKTAKSVTCIDISEKMIERNRKFLGPQAERINYVRGFFQDYETDLQFDVIVSSLVMIHNTHDRALREMTDKMKQLADTIFLFEQVETGIQVSGSTKARSEREYLSYFPEYEVAKRDQYLLYTDTIIFLKLVRIKNKPLFRASERLVSKIKSYICI